MRSLPLLLAGMSGGAAAAQVRHEFRQVHMGVPVRIVVYAPAEEAARAAARVAFERIAELEAVFSDYRPGSEVRRLEGHAGGWVVVSPELFALTTRALELARLTDGAFDPTLGPLTGLWRSARRERRLPDSAALDSARARTGYDKLAIDSSRSAVRLTVAGMRLDLGGIAKGFILDQALLAMRRLGVDQVLLEAGGDIVAGAAPPGRRGWRIEVPGADPAFRARAEHLENAALATSGPTAQFVEVEGVRFSHVLDPRTGVGMTRPLVTHVLAGDGATADALATALGVLGPEGARRVLRNAPGATAAFSPPCPGPGRASGSRRRE